MHPAARILSVGDELVLGRVVDTNAAFLCRLLTDHGFRVLGVQQVGDDQAAIAAAVRAANADAALLVISGGLGPTDDDRTRQALADALGVPLREHAPSWVRICRRYAQVAPGRSIPEINRRQALLPRGAKPLANDRGTAPGIVARSGALTIAVLPGVPHEMQAMAERFATTLPERFPGLTAPIIRELWLGSIGESAAEERLGALMLGETPRVGITVSEYGHLTLRLVGTARQVATRARAMRACVARQLLPAAGLAPSLVARLTALGRTITVAESCTGGQVAAQLTVIPGASAVLRETVVAYDPAAKIARLGVPDTVARTQTVSEACVRAMAAGALTHAAANLALATTGVAGPGGGSLADPVGTVWLGVATRRGTAARRVFIQGTRQRIQIRAAAAALQLGWDALAGAVPLTRR